MAHSILRLGRSSLRDVEKCSDPRGGEQGSLRRYPITARKSLVAGDPGFEYRIVERCAWTTMQVDQSKAEFGQAGGRPPLRTRRRFTHHQPPAYGEKRCATLGRGCRRPKGPGYDEIESVTEVGLTAGHLCSGSEHLGPSLQPQPDDCFFKKGRAPALGIEEDQVEMGECDEENQAGNTTARAQIEGSGGCR